MATVLLLWAQATGGQVTVQAQKAELSIPFGVARGTIVLVGDLLVFVDEENPSASFAVAREDIKEVRTEQEGVTLELARPIRDRSGTRSRASFRILGDAGAGLIDAWHGRTPAAAASAQPAQARAAEGLTLTTSHNHRIGSCSGRLLIREDRLIYESLENVSHSREWVLSEIKKIEQKNPYELKVEPFRGNGYDFRLTGGGLDSAEFQRLADRVARARAGQRAP